MKIQDISKFRTWFKTDHRQKSDPNIDENYIGCEHIDTENKKTFGFYELYHGYKPNIANDLMDGLKNAQDGQAIYEFIQNAADSKSTYFGIFYNEDYFLAINNGSPFSQTDLISILNANQSSKTNEQGQAIDCDKIGRFGIGFKLVHRLVGENDGMQELTEKYKGPIVYSWSDNQISDLLDPVKNKTLSFDENAPLLFKILITNFPTYPNETIKDIHFNERTLFTNEEYKEFVNYFNEISANLDISQLKEGSMFFLKLGKNKKKLLDDQNKSLMNGVKVGLNYLKTLNSITICNNNIKKLPLNLIKFTSQPTDIINPEDPFCPINITFGYLSDYKEGMKELRASSNFYKYFPMSRENHGLNFVLHSTAFRIKTDRTQFEEDIDNTNTSIFQKFWKDFEERLKEIKSNNPNEFNNIYANLLISKPLLDDNGNKKWFYESFYTPLLNFLKGNIPTKTGFSENYQTVKINKLKTQLNLKDFGLEHIQWFEWDNEKDSILIDEARTKLEIKKWDISDLVENADLESINKWISSCSNETYRAFLDELEESTLIQKTKEKICQIKLFKFSDNKFYSFNEVVTKDTLGRAYFHLSNCFYSHYKVKGIKNELIKLGLVISELSVDEYPKIFSSVTLPDDKKHYDLIAKWCVENGNKLSAEEKKNLFLNFINETTKFDYVAESTLKDLNLFCDSNSEIKPLNKLIDFYFSTPHWLNAYKIKEEEYKSFDKGVLKPYIISEPEAIFKEIYLPQQDVILSKLTEANKIKSLIKLYQDNQKQFFNEFIIKKSENGFLIAKKTNNTYQVQSADQEARCFIDTNCSNNLFVLPHEFLYYKEDDGIVKADDLHSLLLEFIDVNKHKETLVDIVKYKAKYKFLQKLTEFKFNSETNYTKEDYEFKILDLACHELKEADFQKFRNSVVIEAGQRNFKLSEISLFTDKIIISNKEFSLSKILPATHQNSNLVGDLISLFTKQGISNEKLNVLFGVNEALGLNDTFKKFTEQVQTFANPEQFFFLIYYNKYIEKVDLSKLGFDLNSAVFPSEFALEKEKLPEYVQNWITKKEIDLSELDEIGVFTENSALVSLRKFFLSQTDFNINTIAEKLSSNEIMLLNTFELLKEKGIELSTDNEFSVFKEIVRVINTSRTDNAKLKEKDERYDFQRLEQNSTQDKTIKGYTIYFYNSQMPNLVQLNEMGDYVFYRYNSDDFAVNGNKIYINDVADRNNVLMQVATYLNDNDFTVSLFGSQNNNDEIEKLRAENQKLKEEKAKVSQNGLDDDTESSNSTFLNDVNEFISELEGTEWNDFVPELKNILELSVSHPKEKQKLFNLIAKIKLAKELDIHFEVANKDYNHLENGNEKYFVHSARGAFAYIHPNEILKMREKGYKMALDFSTKSRIKIYETAEEILQLNTNHILAYQGEKPIEDLITFCKNNSGEKRHLLIIDKDNASEKSRALLKLLNIEDDYQ